MVADDSISGTALVHRPGVGTESWVKAAVRDPENSHMQSVCNLDALELLRSSYSVPGPFPYRHSGSIGLVDTSQSNISLGARHFLIPTGGRSTVNPSKSTVIVHSRWAVLSWVTPISGRNRPS